MATPAKFAAEVIDIRRHSADVVTFEFRCIDRRPRYKPGQFLHLALDAYDPASHWPESRVFTIANGPATQAFIRLTVAAKGRFTSRIVNELVVGRRVWMKAPYGDFIVEPLPDHEVVLIAGGTGVTPFVAFMEDALARGFSGDVWLHYGARSAELLVFSTLAERCADCHSSFRARMYAEKNASGATSPGQIDLDAACLSLRSIRDARFYLCGPQAMVDLFTGRLTREFAVPASHVRVDNWA